MGKTRLLAKGAWQLRAVRDKEGVSQKKGGKENVKVTRTEKKRG